MRGIHTFSKNIFGEKERDELDLNVTQYIDTTIFTVHTNRVAF